MNKLQKEKILTSIKFDIVKCKYVAQLNFIYSFEFEAILAQFTLFIFLFYKKIAGFILLAQLDINQPLTAEKWIVYKTLFRWFRCHVVLDKPEEFLGSTTGRAKTKLTQTENTVISKASQDGKSIEQSIT